MKNLVYNLCLALILAAGISMALPVQPLVPFVGIIGAQLTYGIIRVAFSIQLPSGILADAADVSALTAYAGKNQKALIATMLNMMDFLKDVMVVPNVKNKLRIGKLKVGNGTRPFSSNEEFGSGDLQYTDRFLEVDAFKRELKIDPEVYRTTYLSEFLSAGSSAAKKEIPFAAYTWREVLKAFWAEINDNAAWGGFDKSEASAFNAGSTYAAGDYITYTPTGSTVVQWYKCLAATTAGQDPDDTPAKWELVTSSAIFKGFGTLITELVDATELTEQGIGAIDATAGVARGAFLEMFRAMPVVYQKSGVIINCGYTDFNYLIDDIEDISKYTRADVTAGQPIDHLILPNTNNKCIVKPGTWITGRRMVSGPAKKVGNDWKNAALLFGTDLLSDTNTITTKSEGELWTMKAGIKSLGGTQIANLEEIRINDQA